MAEQGDDRQGGRVREAVVGASHDAGPAVPPDGESQGREVQEAAQVDGAKDVEHETRGYPEEEVKGDQKQRVRVRPVLQVVA